MKRIILLFVLLLSVGWIIRSPNRSNYVAMPGTTGNYPSMPDNAANSPTGDFTWVAQIFHDNASSTVREGFILKEDGAYNNFRFFKFHIAPFTRISFLNSTGAINNTFNNQWTSSAFSPGNGTWFWVKVEFDSDVGGGNQLASLYWKQNFADSWIDVSSTGALSGTGSDDFPTDIRLGYIEGTSEYLDGGIAYAVQYPTANETGTPDWEFNANRMRAGQTTYTDTYSGLVWTINQSGSPAAEIVEVP